MLRTCLKQMPVETQGGIIKETQRANTNLVYGFDVRLTIRFTEGEAAQRDGCRAQPQLLLFRYMNCENHVRWHTCMGVPISENESEYALGRG